MNKKKTEQIDELEAYKAVAFYLARLHRVKPEGERLKKTPKEIDDMTLATIEHMAANVNDKVLSDYRTAADRKKG